MAREPFHLVILAPGKTLLEVEAVTQIQVKLSDGGGLGVYPGHAPLLAETVTAPLTYWDSEGEHSLEVKAGILHIQGDRISIFTSGLTRSQDDTFERPAEQSVSDLQFDRLARELLARMQAQPDEMPRSDEVSAEDRSPPHSMDGSQTSQVVGRLPAASTDDGLSASSGEGTL